jgi:zinc protease
VPAPALKENILLTHKDKVQLERIYLGWHSDIAYSKDDAELDILSDILSGSKNSRLYKNIVFDKELAQDISAYQFSGKFAGFFFIVATAKPGVKLNKLKEEIFNELNKIRNEGINPEFVKEILNENIK